MKKIPLYGKSDGESVIVGWAVVDNRDWRQLSKFRWHKTSRGYAGRRDYSNGRPGVMTLMHRVIMELEKGDARQVDHINRWRLDNRRKNLRVLLAGQQSHNIQRRGNFTSKFRGVSWDKKTNKWIAVVHCKGKKNVAGYFKSEAKAATAAKQLRQELLSHAVD